MNNGWPTHSSEYWVQIGTDIRIPDLGGYIVKGASYIPTH